MLVFYCCVRNYNLVAQNNTHLFAHSSLVINPGPVWMGSLDRVSQSRVLILSSGSSSHLTESCEQNSVFSTCRSEVPVSLTAVSEEPWEGCSQPLVSISSFPMWPFIFKAPSREMPHIEPLSHFESLPRRNPNQHSPD